MHRNLIWRYLLRRDEEAPSRHATRLRKLRGVNSAIVAALEAVGVDDTARMLSAGRTPELRALLALRAAVPVAAVLELVKRADLARLPGGNGKRGRLYYEAGVDTPAAIAAWDPMALHVMLGAFVEQTGFDGRVPTLSELESTVAAARALPPVVEY